MKKVFHIFNKHAPIKRKYIRANEAPFMTKDLHKAIMKRSKLRNKFLKSRNLSVSRKILWKESFFKIIHHKEIFVKNY